MTPAYPFCKITTSKLHTGNCVYILEQNLMSLIFVIVIFKNKLYEAATSSVI